MSKSEKRMYSVFIGNLPFDLTESELDQYFQDTPDYAYASIPKENNGKSKGFGFLHFANELSARKAMRSSDGMLISGRKVFCRWGSVLRKESKFGNEPMGSPELEAARQSDKEWQQTRDEAFHSKENGKSSNNGSRRRQRKRSRRHDSDYDDYDYDRKRGSHYGQPYTNNNNQGNQLFQPQDYNQYNTDRMIQQVLSDPTFSMKLQKEVERQRQMQGLPQQNFAQFQYQQQSNQQFSPNPCQPMFIPNQNMSNQSIQGQNMQSQGMQNHNMGQIPNQSIQMPPMPPIPPSQQMFNQKPNDAYQQHYAFRPNQNSDQFGLSHNSLQQQLFNQMNDGQNNIDQIMNKIRFMSNAIQNASNTV